MRRKAVFSACLLVAVRLFSSGVAAANNSTAEPVDGGSGGVGSRIQEALASLLMDSVKGLAETLSQLLLRVFVSYPDVTQPMVLELHQKVFEVSLVLASAAVVLIGLMHMTNRIDGVRPLVYLLSALVFGAVAPELLRYPVELSQLTTEALAPSQSNLLEVSRFTIELFLVLLIDVLLLLGTVIIFLGRDVFLMLGVGLAPLIALMAATPPLRGYADMLTGFWIACLLIGPLNVVVLDLTLSFMGTNILVPGNYLWALAGIALLFGLPLVLLGAGVVAFAPLTRIAGQASGAAQPRIRRKVKDMLVDQEDEGSRPRGSRGDRGNRFRRRGGD